MPIDKIIDPSIAAGAYGTGAALAKGAPLQGRGEPSFADFLQKTARDSLDTMKGGEMMAAKAVTGDADLTDVVQAVTAAELALQTVVSIRDRLISAYQEIMRMPM